MSYRIARLNWDELEGVYYNNMQNDFPKCEIKPISLIKRLWQNGNNVSLGLFDEKGLCAYAIFEKPDVGNVVLLDYLAVEKSKRGKGCGSFFVKEFKNLLKDFDAVMVEIERIDKASNEEERQTREKRKKFYLMNGHLETGVNTVADGNMDYEILCNPIKKSVTGEDAAKGMEDIYKTFFKEGEYSIEW